eukprot:1143204-Pelagomonas_calceolata.AAC.5
MKGLQSDRLTASVFKKGGFHLLVFSPVTCAQVQRCPKWAWASAKKGYGARKRKSREAGSGLKPAGKAEAPRQKRSTDRLLRPRKDRQGQGL